MGVNATPTMFVNGERLEGALDIDQVKSGFEPAVAGGWSATTAATSAGPSMQRRRQAPSK